MIITRAQASDAADLLGIYSYYVRETAVSFEHEVPSIEEFTERIKNISAKYPYLIAVDNDKIIGYAYANTFKPRESYDWAVESTIYIDKDHRRKGVGGKLYTALADSLRSMGILNMNACIALPLEGDEHVPADSYIFHKKMGFKEVGTFHTCGYKFDTWYDMMWMEKMLGAHTSPQERVRFGEWTL